MKKPNKESPMRKLVFFKQTGLIQAAQYAALGLMIASVASAETGRPHRPNIIFMLADDIGITGVSSYGADRFTTPAIDDLAGSGVRFETAFSAPICGPSRVQALTGRYGFRTGATNNGPASKVDPRKELSIARVLRDAGYATAAVGKWSQLAFVETAELRQAWGFDEMLLWVGAGAEGEQRYWGPTLRRNGEAISWPTTVYGPDAMQDFVVDFMRRKKATGQPFFVYYPNPLPHAPRERTPDSAADVERSQIYPDQVRYLDKQVGRLVASLEKLGLRENTLVVFAGDNGSVGGGTLKGRRIAGGKGSLTEGACRVPLICSWPAVMPAGRVVLDLVDFSDLFPTFCEVAGAELPSDRVIDGRSFAPQLQGKKGSPREWVYGAIEKPEGFHRFVRDANWMLTGAGVLTSTKDAPFTEIRVRSEEPEAIAARHRLQSILSQLQ